MTALRISANNIFKILMVRYWTDKPLAKVKAGPCDREKSSLVFVSFSNEKNDNNKVLILAPGCVKVPCVTF